MSYARTVLSFGNARTSSGILTHYFVNLDCGHTKAANTDNPWSAETTYIRGQQVECKACQEQEEREKDALSFILSLTPGMVQHVRYKRGSYHFYRRDTSSPTGVFLIRSTIVTDAIDKALVARGLSPLSPTEPR